MKNIIICTQNYNTPDSLQEYLKQELEFPDYYGGNLAALYDCLTELSGPVTICFQADSYASEEMENYMKKVLTVCIDASMENDQIRLIQEQEEEI